MRDIEIKIDENGYAEYVERFIGNQYENDASQLVFDLPAGYVGKGYYQYALFNLSNDKTIVRKIVDNKCIIDRDITNVAGLTLIQVIVKNIEGADDLSDGVVICSQPISCYIKPSNYNSDKITNESIDKNIIVLLEEFDALLAEIRATDKRLADISNANVSMTEVIDARGGYTVLKNRLDAIASNVSSSSTRSITNSNDIKSLIEAIQIERNRIDSLSKLENGSTTGDAELIDIRNGYDGTVYDTAGEAIRKPLSVINNALSGETVYPDILNPENWEIGGIGIVNNNTDNSARLRLTKGIKVPKNTIISVNDGYKFNIVCVSSPEPNNSNVIQFKQLNSCNFKVNQECYIRMCVGTLNDDTITDVNIISSILNINTNGFKSVLDNIDYTLDKIEILDNIDSTLFDTSTDEIPFSINGYYQNDTFIQADTSYSTEKISLEGVTSILYTGAMGTQTATWYDENGEYLGYNLGTTGTTYVDHEVLNYKLTGAKYVRLSSRNENNASPPMSTPKVIVKSHKLKNETGDDLDGIVGDGEIDDTVALQKLIDNSNGILRLKCKKYLLSSSLIVDINKIKLIDGGNATFIVNGDFTAFILNGSLTSDMSANPNTLNDDIMNIESNTIIKNCKITSTNPKVGNGIKLSGCFKTNIENCYIFKLNNGITISDQNRDISIFNNHIYGCYNNGLTFDDTSNLHQCNINGNFISYCHYCVALDKPVQVANFQFNGNDIELSSYPSSSDTTGRAVYIASGDTESGQLSEIEFAGNTIQGHNVSNSLIELIGGTKREIYHVSFTSNHISNAKEHAFIISKVGTVSISGNTYKSIGNQILYIKDSAHNISISGESANAVGGLIYADDTSNLNRVVIGNCVVSGSTDGGINIVSKSVKSVSIISNVIAGSLSKITVQPVSVSKCIVANNIVETDEGYSLSDDVVSYNNI